MNRILKTALLASAAVFVLGAVAPAFAQQDNMQAAAAKRQGVYQPVEPDRGAAVRDFDTTVDSSEAFAYQPSGPVDSCTTEGSYGKGVDYGACGGGD